MKGNPYFLDSLSKRLTLIYNLFLDIHQDLATAGKRAVRPPAVARSGGREAILRKSNM